MKKVRKLVKFLSIFLLLSTLFVGFSQKTLAQNQGTSTSEPAQGINPIEPPQGIGPNDSIILPPDYYPRDQEPGFLGQDHNYSVVFRGNGEAVVSLRVAFTNKGDENLSSLSLRVPKVEPKDLAVYQIIRDKVCIRYKSQVYDPLTRSYPPQVCEEYQEPDHYQYYYGAPSKYQKAKFDYKGDTLTISLPQSIAVNKSGSFFVYFRAFGYAKKNIFGSFDYHLETLKVDDSIRNLQLGIATDSDLVLKGVKGEVSYRFEAPQLASLEKSAGAPAASTALDSYISQIGQGGITKTASNLSPLESYKVSGAFASNRLKLYGKEIAVGAGVTVVILLILLWTLKKILKGFKQTVKEAPQKTAISPNSQMILASAGLGFISALLITGYTVGAILLGNLLGSITAYYYQLQPLLFIFLLLISGCVYLLLIFGPAILVGMKKGTGWGIVVVVSTVVWLVVFLGVAVLTFFLLGKGVQPPVILPLMGETLQKPASR